MNLLFLVWRNACRQPWRLALTLLSVTVAFFLFTALAGIDHALNASVAGSNQLRLMTSHRVSLTRSLPLQYQQKIAALPGVAVSHASWFGGFFRDESGQLAMTAVAADNYFSLFPEFELAPGQLAAWQGNRTGLVIGQAVADKYQWRVGDRVPIQSSIWMNRQGSFTWEFEVMAIYRGREADTDPARVFLHHGYFDEARAYGRHGVGWYSTRLAQAGDAGAVAAAIDALFVNASDATRTTTEQVFVKEQARQFVDMAMVIRVVVAAVFFSLMLIVCNTMVQSVRERLHELAMMKALGFSSSRLAGQLFFEALLLLGGGALVGALLARASLALLQRGFADLLPGIDIMPFHYGAAALLALAAALVSSLWPAWAVRRLAISQTLGGR